MTGALRTVMLIAAVLAVLYTVWTWSSLGDEPRDGTHIFMFALCALSAVFMAVFSRSNWRASTAGKALMYAMGGVFLIALQESAFYLFGEHVWVYQIREIVLMLVCLAQIGLIGTVLRAQHNSKGGERQ